MCATPLVELAHPGRGDSGPTICSFRDCAELECAEINTQNPGSLYYDGWLGKGVNIRYTFHSKPITQIAVVILLLAVSETYQKSHAIKHFREQPSTTQFTNFDNLTRSNATVCKLLNRYISYKYFCWNIYLNISISPQRLNWGTFRPFFTYSDQKWCSCQYSLRS